MQMGENMEKQAKKMEEKQKKHDPNVKAMHYEELINFLPENVDDYTIDGETNGESIDMAGMSYSTADVRFKNDNGDYIKITLMDYNAAYNLYGAATGMWAMGMKIDSKTELSQGIKFSDNINGWESFKKKTGKAELVLGVGDRFLLTINGSNQENCDFLKDVAKSMDLDKLAAME